MMLRDVDEAAGAERVEADPERRPPLRWGAAPAAPSAARRRGPRPDARRCPRTETRSKGSPKWMTSSAGRPAGPAARLRPAPTACPVSVQRRSTNRRERAATGELPVVHWRARQTLHAEVAFVQAECPRAALESDPHAPPARSSLFSPCRCPRPPPPQQPPDFPARGALPPDAPLAPTGKPTVGRRFRADDQHPAGSRRDHDREGHGRPDRPRRPSAGWFREPQPHSRTAVRRGFSLDLDRGLAGRPLLTTLVGSLPAGRHDADEDGR